MVCLAVLAATFLAVVCAALLLRVRREAVSGDLATSSPRAREGVVFLLRDRTLRLAMITAFGSLLFMSAVWVGELFFVEDVLHRGDVE
jgi:hypothetical protein